MKYLLLVFSLTALPLFAQVGINTDDPGQMLDVNGKMKIGTDGRTPTEGTLRFNPTTRQFEGYNGTEWNALDNEPPVVNNDAIPEGAIVVYGKTFGLVADDSTLDFRIYYGDGSGSFINVPANTYLVVTWLNMRDNDVNPAVARVLGRVGPRTSGTGFINSTRGLYMQGTFPDMIWTESSLSPLVIVPSGQRLSGSNSRFSEDAIEFEMRGFLVPNLTY